MAPVHGDEDQVATERPGPRRLADVVSDLWHQKPGVRQARPGATERVLSAKAVVNGLDRRELGLGVAAVALDLVVTVAVYLYWSHSSDAKFHHYAPEFLVAGLIGVAILALGTAFRRRALLGFGAFMVGMELVSFGIVYGILYLFFGGWLIVRVMRRQKQDQALGRASASSGARARATTRASGSPKASKRYTPPRRTSAATRRR